MPGVAEHVIGGVEGHGVNHSEMPLLFEVAGEQLLGIAALPESAGDCGVVMVVGGPQYRVGSHRQFLLLSRRLADAGFPTFRFDYRGMGDSTGALRDFECVSDDLGAAIDAFVQACPQVKKVILWGLCDAASAILLALHAKPDERVCGVVLLNPWVRSETSLAQTHIKHYYGQRLMQAEFWRKLFSGKLRIFASAREFLSNAAKARGGRAVGRVRAVSFQDRMAAGLRQFSGQTLLVLSEQDYTAREFIDYANADQLWEGLIASPGVTRCDIPDADHTFSSAVLRSRVEDETLAWLERFRTG